jgi:hypothetical protein|tara:strand:+ start:139 stop:1083 length:945 start_codon:yes stop_codon:yes gene_type:complete
MKIIKIIQEILKLHKIGFPNSSFKRLCEIDAKNLYYALKNIQNKERELDQYKNLNLSHMWSQYNSHLEFQHKFYSKKDYLFSPVIKAVTGGFHTDIKYKIEIKEQLEKVKIVSYNLEKAFPSITFSQWYNALSITLGIINHFNKDKIDLYSKLKDLAIIEFGPGSGIHSLLYQSISNNTHILYDLPQMQTIQKFLINKYFSDDIKKLNKFHYFTDLQNLDKFLDGRKFCFISQWAFSETPMSLRLLFEKILFKSDFAMFTSNAVMSGVDNNKYFNDLSKKLSNHTYINKYLDGMTDELPNFMKKHKIHLFYKDN